MKEFLNQVEELIAEINKLNKKINSYQNNSKIFGISFDVAFFISDEIFLQLRDFLKQKISENVYYDVNIINLKRVFLKESAYIISNINLEITRIDEFQEKELNKIVYATIYNSRIENEIELRNSFYLKSSMFDKLLGIDKFRKLSYINHDLKARLIEKEYKEKVKQRKSIFELVCMLEGENYKNSKILCLKEDMIKAFFIDKNLVNKNINYVWKRSMLIPYGILKKMQYYKKINIVLQKENEELQEKLKERDIFIESEINVAMEKLKLLNMKLSKIVKIALN